MAVNVVEFQDIVVIDASCDCVGILSAVAVWTDKYTPWELVHANYKGVEEGDGLTHVFEVSSPDILPPRKVFVVMEWSAEYGE